MGCGNSVLVNLKKHETLCCAVGMGMGWGGAISSPKLGHKTESCPRHKSRAGFCGRAP